MPTDTAKFEKRALATEMPNWISEKCIQCGLCFPVCPEDAIPVGKDQKRTDFDFDYCKGCGVCAKVCPFGAIVMKTEGE